MAKICFLLCPLLRTNSIPYTNHNLRYKDIRFCHMCRGSGHKERVGETMKGATIFRWWSYSLFNIPQTVSDEWKEPHHNDSFPWDVILRILSTITAMPITTSSTMPIQWAHDWLTWPILFFIYWLIEIMPERRQRPTDSNLSASGTSSK